jgi:hypothetical protein
VSFYRTMTMLLAGLTAGLGLTILVVTAVHGGGTTGILLGVMFVAAGGGRLYLMRRRA